MKSLTIKSISNDKARTQMGLGLVVAMSIFLSIVSFLLFAKSSAYDTVRQLHNATLNTPVNIGDGIDTTSPVKVSDIEEFGRSVKERASTFDDQADFSMGSLSEEQIGF